MVNKNKAVDLQKLSDPTDLNAILYLRPDLTFKINILKP